MAHTQFSDEAISTIVFGILQLTVGLISLWQQRSMRQMQGV
jgi:hypothetical protein